MGFIESIRGAFTGSSSALDEARAELRILKDNEGLLHEKIADLELAIDDQGWQALAGLSEFDFSRGGLQKLIELSRRYYIKNPIINRAVNLQAYYVFGQGITIHHEGDLDEVLQGYITHPANQRTLFSADAMMSNERTQRVEGNFFLRIFRDTTSGRVEFRKLRIDEMKDVLCNPEDRDEPWFYLRQWTDLDGVDHEVLYPDWRHERARRLDDEYTHAGHGQDEYRGVRIEWETPVLHRKTGAFGDMKFGVPEVYAALDWVRSYKESLEDYRSTVKSLARWAWKMKTGGGSAQLQAAQRLLASTLGDNGSWDEDNPAPTTGAMFAYTGDLDLRAVDISKAVIDPDGFRRLMLMAASALGLPETFFGSTDGTFATAKTLDRPTELAFRARQDFWADVFRDCLTICVECAAEAPGGKVSSGGYDEITGRMKLRAGGKDVKLHIEVDYPPILQKDVQAQMAALVQLLSLNGQPLQVMNDGPTILRLGLTALGEDDIEKTVELFYPKDGSESKARPIETFEAPPTPAEKNAQPEPDPALNPFLPQRGVNPTGAKSPGAPAGGPDRTPPGDQAAGRSQESDDESQARVEFMRSLIELRRQMSADERP